MFAVVLIACVVAGAHGASVIKQLAVVHRHGARNPVPTVNASALCPGGAANCGILTLQGKQMLNNLGKHLRNAYNETIQPATYYDPDVVHTQSTDVDRTIQSAGCLLHGLFSSLEGTANQVYPVIHTQEIQRETELLVWDGWPALLLWSFATQKPFFAMVDEAILNIISPVQLAAIGEEIGLMEECDPRSPGFFAFQCAIDAEDFYSYSLTVGTAGKLPITAQFYPQLEACLETYNRYAMGKFDQITNGGKFEAAVGTYGYYLMQDILQQFMTPSWSATAPDAGGRRLSHYSGHDITLMPLTNTLGNTTMLNPPFGTAIVFEEWGPEGDDTVDNAFIAVKFGLAGQTPESNYEYEFTNFTLTCINSSGNTYTSADGCPLMDLVRFVETRGPQSPMGICYANQSTLEAINCTVCMPAPPNTYCSYYRSMCIDACGPNGAMTANLTCVGAGTELCDDAGRLPAAASYESNFVAPSLRRRNTRSSHLHLNL